METLSNVAGMLAGTLTNMKSPKISGKAADGVGFDSMIRGKYEQADQQKTQKQPENEQKDSETVETKDDAQASKEGAQEKSEAVKEPEKLEDMKQRYEMAAALMFQNQPEYVEAPQPTVEVQQTEAVVEAMPEVVEQTVMPETVELKQAEVITAAPETTEVSEAPAEVVEEVIPKQEMSSSSGEERGSDADTAAEAPKVLQVSEVPKEEEGETVEVSEEAPVFGEVEAAPVKVAEAPAKPVEIQAQDAPEQLSERIEIPREEGTSTAVIELAPESLGKITVQITRSADGTLSVLLHASTPKAAAVLEQHSNGLQNLLSLRNDAEVRIEVRGGEENHQQFLDPNGRNNQQGQQQNRQQQEHGERQNEHQATDFIQQLRLGLVDIDRSAFN